jgi:hypothetical protein
MLQSKAGYIDARPHIRQLEQVLLQRTAGPYIGSEADLTPSLGHVRFAPQSGHRWKGNRFARWPHADSGKPAGAF